GFSYQIDWGDGSAVQTVQGTGGDYEVYVSHVFTRNGTFTVKVKAVDKDGGVSDPETVNITVKAVEVQPDPLHPGETVLAAGRGARGTEVLTCNKGRKDTVTVELNGQSLGTFAAPDRLAAFGQAGNDVITVDENLKVAAWLDGGDGDDALIGGKGDDVLRGG